MPGIKTREARWAAQHRARARQQRLRAAVFGVVVLGVLILAGALLYSAFAKPKLEKI